MLNILKKNKSLIALLLGVILIIFLYGKFRCVFTDYIDPLEHNVNLHIDGWLTAHYVLFSVIGFNFPRAFYLAMFMGILWEIFEHIIGQLKPSILNNITNCNRKSFTHFAEPNGRYWWYGKKEDILVNFLGFVTGYFIKNNI